MSIGDPISTTWTVVGVQNKIKLNRTGVGLTKRSLKPSCIEEGSSSESFFEPFTSFVDTDVDLTPSSSLLIVVVVVIPRSPKCEADRCLSVA